MWVIPFWFLCPFETYSLTDDIPIRVIRERLRRIRII